MGRQQELREVPAGDDQQQVGTAEQLEQRDM
jgi:hypothetical protein